VQSKKTRKEGGMSLGGQTKGGEQTPGKQDVRHIKKKSLGNKPKNDTKGKNRNKAILATRNEKKKKKKGG